jgi:MFS family permease
MAGFVLDSYDVLLYVFVVQTLRAEFHWTAATAGLVSSATLITSALGGIGAGFLSDRIGRRRTLVLTILIYSIGSGGCDGSVSEGQRISARVR